MVFLAGLDIDLQRGLAVQFDGDIHHVAAFVETVRWGICPSTCQVDADRATSPHNLVGIDIEARLLLASQSGFGQAFAHQAKGTVFIFLIGFSLQLHDTGTEHLVADARHHRHGFGQGLRQRKLMASILTGGIFQVELVEDAVLVVLGKDAPVGDAECLALGSETAQVGGSGDFVGRELPATHPNFLACCQSGFGHHPTHHEAQFFDRGSDREKAGGLQVMGRLNIGQRQATLIEPLGERTAQIMRGGI